MTTTLVKNVVETVKHASKDTTLEYVVKMAKLDVVATMDTHLADVNAGNTATLYQSKYKRNSTQQCCGNTGNTICSSDETCCGDINGDMICCSSSENCANGACVPKTVECPAEKVCADYSGQKCCGDSQTCYQGYHSGICCEDNEVGCCGNNGNALGGCKCR